MTLGMAARRAREDEPLAGRTHELASLQRELDELDHGRTGSVALLGEPGIGKTRLLRELTMHAEQRSYLVLAGSASELEQDLPFSAFVDALDEYVESLEPKRLSALDDDVQAELGHVFPSLASLARGREVALQHERYRSHRAVRGLVELLAEEAPLVLVLDDFHWADSASIELLGALLRRPPSAAVLIALALRPRPPSERLAAALDSAHRAGALNRIELGTLSADEARELLGATVAEADASALYHESGGNPFYLEQLARSPDRAADAPIAALSLSGVPSAVAASLSEELSLLSEARRLLLEGAAVAGDPFEPELAAAAAAISEAAAIDALDELLQLDLIRSTDVPRRFRFRHPLVRRAVYETTSSGWRLGAHERCAQALAARGARAFERAHHVERSARDGDLAAVSVLCEAGEGALRLAPASAARWFGAALRLLPQSAPTPDRVELLVARARALAAAGRFTESHEAMLEAVATVPVDEIELNSTVATACAAVERFLGRYEEAHGRLVAALRALPEPTSVGYVELLIELTLNEFYRSRYEAMHDWAERAVSAAKGVGDPPLLANALALRSLADATSGRTETARSSRSRAAAAVDDLSDDELSLRPDAAAWLAAAEIYLDLYAEADAHASRAFELARTTGRGDPLFRLYSILPRIWYVRGKLREAAELLDAAIEGSRLLGSPPALAGNFFNRAIVALAGGDLDVALATAEEGVELTDDLDGGFVAAWAAVRLAAVLLEIGQPAEAVEILLSRAGGEKLPLLPGGWRAYGFALLTRCWLQLDRRREAAGAAALAKLTAAASKLPLANAWADHAAAAMALHDGNAKQAVERALASARTAHDVGAPIEEALSRTLAGRALARANEPDRAVAELQHAAAALDACGALGYRDQAERELGKLGHRIHRRTRPGNADGIGIETLTARELQVAELVVDRRTNPEIAAQLFLSNKTVESHLRNIFRKMSVSSRVELARTVERATRAASAQQT
jgi:ATP/maltotriose-dependent transcriptional regulator MalT